MDYSYCTCFIFSFCNYVFFPSLEGVWTQSPGDTRRVPLCLQLFSLQLALPVCPKIDCRKSGSLRIAEILTVDQSWYS